MGDIIALSERLVRYVGQGPRDGASFVFRYQIGAATGNATGRCILAAAARGAGGIAQRSGYRIRPEDTRPSPSVSV